MTLKLAFTVPQAAADQIAAGLSVIDDLVFDRAASPSGGIGLTREDPKFPIQCVLYVESQAAARHAQAMIEIIADLAGFEVPDIDHQVVEAQDWVKLTQDSLPPIEVGPFYLRGSHSPEPPQGQIDLRIDAGLAFGTGHHETTRGCLQLYTHVLELGAPRRVLDMGCGSGVLAMAAAKTTAADIIGIELDADSLTVAQDNATLNGVADRIKLIAGGEPHLGGGNYDLIFANILAGPLIMLAPGLTAVADPGAHLLLAGLLIEQEADVRSAYEALGWTQHQGFHDGQWALLWLKR